MPRLLCLKVSEEEKSLFSKLVEEEGTTVSQALRDLMEEAISRGYIVKERKERRQQMRKVTTSDA